MVRVTPARRRLEGIFPGLLEPAQSPGFGLGWGSQGQLVALADVWPRREFHQPSAPGGRVARRGSGPGPSGIWKEQM